jgi:hypothetical protein
MFKKNFTLFGFFVKQTVDAEIKSHIPSPGGGYSCLYAYCYFYHSEFEKFYAAGSAGFFRSGDCLPV